MLLHKNTYRSSSSPAELREQIEQLIEVEAEDTFRVHWKYKSIAGNQQIIGKTTKNGGYFWRTNATFSGIFYPVFYLYFPEGEQRDAQVVIGSQFNNAAEVLALLILVPLVIGLLSFLLMPGATPVGVLIKLLISVALLIIFGFLPYYAYSSVRKQTLEELIKYFRLH